MDSRSSSYNSSLTSDVFSIMCTQSSFSVLSSLRRSNSWHFCQSSPCLRKPHISSPLRSLLCCRNQNPHQKPSATRTLLGRDGVSVGKFSVSELESWSRGRESACESCRCSQQAEIFRGRFTRTVLCTLKLHRLGPLTWLPSAFSANAASIPFFTALGLYRLGQGQYTEVKTGSTFILSLCASPSLFRLLSPFSGKAAPSKHTPRPLLSHPAPAGLLLYPPLISSDAAVQAEPRFPQGLWLHLSDLFLTFNPTCCSTSPLISALYLWAAANLQPHKAFVPDATAAPGSPHGQQKGVTSISRPIRAHAMKKIKLLAGKG